MIEATKTLVRRALRIVDLDLVRTHTTLEGHVMRLLQSLDVSLVLDVGAHHGEYASMLRDLGYRGWIASFEPVPASFKKLEARHGRDRKWLGYAMALGAARGRLPMNITGTSDLNSFLRPSAQGKAWFGANVEVKRTEEVTVHPLDGIMSIITEVVPNPRAYLKMDTQGYDAQVIAGARRSLDRHILALQTEIAAQPLYDGLAPFPDNLQPFLGLGFEPTGMFAVSRDPRDMIAAIEYDLVMRRRPTS